MSGEAGLIIVGAGGLGREVYAYAQDCRSAGTLGAQVLGFADDRSDALDGFGVPEQLRYAEMLHPEHIIDA